MKKIKYIMASNLMPVTMPWSEANEAIAKVEANNGEYTIYDDGQPEPVAPASDAPTWDDLAAALREGVNAV